MQQSTRWTDVHVRNTSEHENMPAFIQNEALTPGTKGAPPCLVRVACMYVCMCMYVCVCMCMYVSMIRTACHVQESVYRHVTHAHVHVYTLTVCVPKAARQQ